MATERRSKKKIKWCREPTQRTQLQEVKMKNQGVFVCAEAELCRRWLDGRGTSLCSMQRMKLCWISSSPVSPDSLLLLACLRFQSNTHFVSNKGTLKQVMELLFGFERTFSSGYDIYSFEQLKVEHAGCKVTRFSPKYLWYESNFSSCDLSYKVFHWEDIKA